MRWGIRKQNAAALQCVQEDEGERGGGKGKGKAFSFSPLSWFGRLAGKESASKPKPGAAAPSAFPSCLPKRTSPSPAAVAPRRSPDTAADTVPRRLSVSNDNAAADAVRRHGQHRRRHCSLGGDRDLPPLGHLIPFSLTGSPGAAPPRPAPAGAIPSDADAGPARTNRRRRHRRRSTRRLSSGGRRSSFSGSSGRMATVPVRAAVRVRSPRRVHVAPELERLAVVRRTRDPQRAFRESMVEMVASSGGRPEELERLLACYLSLNADEHHDCIVKVFRQVWFEYINLLQLQRHDSAGRGRRRPPPPSSRR